MKFAAAAKETTKTKGIGGKFRFAAIVNEIGKIIATAATFVIYAAKNVVITYIPNNKPILPRGRNTVISISAINSAALDLIIAVPNARAITIINANL